MGLGSKAALNTVNNGVKILHHTVSYAVDTATRRIGDTNITM